MARYAKPSGIVRIINHFVGRLASVGLTPSNTVCLTVCGRTSGQPRSTAVTLARYKGEDFLVSLAGDLDWVRNIRAAGGEAVVERGRKRSVHALEIPVEERAPVLHAYMQRRALTKSPATIARTCFGVSPDAEPSDLEAVASRHPVFKIEYEPGQPGEELDREQGGQGE